jgi:hypothetical protein
MEKDLISVRIECLKLSLRPIFSADQMVAHAKVLEDYVLGAEKKAEKREAESRESPNSPETPKKKKSGNAILD